MPFINAFQEPERRRAREVVVAHFKRLQLVPKCQICGAMRWNVAEPVIPPTWGPNGVELGNGPAVVPMTCERCAAVVFLAWKPMVEGTTP